jgi:hypothetical protein
MLAGFGGVSGICRFGALAVVLALGAGGPGPVQAAEAAAHGESASRSVFPATRPGAGVAYVANLGGSVTPI